jgi:hypothetical protein
LNSRNTQYTAKALAGARMAVEIAPDGTIRLVPVTAPYELLNPTAAVANMSGRSCFDWRHVPPATSRLVDLGERYRKLSEVAICWRGSQS